MPPEILGSIVERTDGIPLFVEELTKSLLEGGLLREEDVAYVLDGPLPSRAIPPSLEALLLARLDRLSRVKDVAQIGAAIGREFSYELLAAVARFGEAELRKALGELTAAGLVFCRGALPRASYIFKHVLVQDVAYGTLLRDQRQELHARIAQALEEYQEISTRQHAALLAGHWLKAENSEKALHYTIEAAKQAAKLGAGPEAISHYWQALDLLERLPPTPERNRAHADTIFAMSQWPSWQRGEASTAQMLRHVDRALAHATEAGQLATIARLEGFKGHFVKDEFLIKSAIAHAQASGDSPAQAATSYSYGMYLGGRARYAESLEHIKRAIEIMGDQGELYQQAQMMLIGGRCFSARAGNLADSFAYATRARQLAEELDNAQLRARSAMEAEPYMYKGAWDEVIRLAEEWLPVAREMREWFVVLWSSAWLAIAYLKLKRPTEARRILDRVFAEVPLRGLGVAAYAIPYGHIAVAQLHLQTNHPDLALDATRKAITSSQENRAPLEEGAAHRVLGQVCGAMGARNDADTAFRRSLEILEKIQSPPELAQSLLEYGRFLQGDNALEDRRLIERALNLFQAMDATGWIEEARVALNQN